MTPKRAPDVRLMPRPRLRNIVTREARLSRNPEVAKVTGQPSPAHLPLNHQPVMVARSASAPPPLHRRRWEETASGSSRRRLGVGSNALEIAVRLVETHGVAGASCGCQVKAYPPCSGGGQNWPIGSPSAVRPGLHSIVNVSPMISELMQPSRANPLSRRLVPHSILQLRHGQRFGLGCRGRA